MSLKLPRLFQHYRSFFLLVFICPALSFASGSEQDPFGIGMGDAVAAIAGGTNAIEWNPAGIARANVPMGQLGFGIDPTTSNFQFNTSVLYPSQDGTVFALSQFTDFPKSANSSTTYVGSVAFPFNSSKDFYLGLNLKYLVLSAQTPSGIENGEGLGLDMGLAYDLRDPQGTIASFGLSIKDLATNIRFNNTVEEPVVRNFVLGAAYQEIPDTRIEMDYDIVDQTIVSSNLHNRLRLGAEEFFDNRFYSLRVGYDDLFNNDGFLSCGAGYHPNEPFEITYAFRISTTNSENSHFLSLVYRLDDWGKKETQTTENKPSTSSEINIGDLSELVENPSVGKPVSGVPLHKMTIEVDPQVFSPTGKQKTTSISFPGDHSSDVARWWIGIENANHKVIRRFGGTGPLLPSFDWDGLDEQGRSAGNGKYQISLKTFSRKNELLSNDSGMVEILAPRSLFELQTAGTYFSTAAGAKGKGDIAFKVNAGGSADVESWDFEISEASTNKVVFEKQGKSKLPKTLKWNGKNLNGERSADGAYLCLLIAQDQAGNSLKTDALQIVLNNTPPDLTLKGESSWADFASKKDFRFSLNAADRVGIETWNVQITNEDGDVIKNFKASSQPPSELVWNGMGDDGKQVDAGSFATVVFSATDKAGNLSTTDPVPVQVDYHPPSGQEQMTLNLTTVYFNDGSSNLTESAKKEMDKAATSIKPYLNKSMLVVKGYTSPTENGDVLTLSHDRALVVKKYLMKVLGIAENNIYAVGYSNRDPLKTSPNAVTEDPQRRAVITLTTLQ